MRNAQETTREIETAGPILAARGSNQSGMRAYNERLVLSLIRRHGALAKAEISRLTGLSAQTVSVIMRALEAEGLLEKGEPVRGRVGQPSVPMNLKRDGAFFLGLKVGRRSLDLVLIDFLGRIEKRVRRTHRYPEPDDVVRFANGAITEILEGLPAGHRSRVAGLGIAIPFRLWSWADQLGVEPSKMAGWRDRDIASEIGEAWDFPVYLRNDATAACGAELVFGDKDKPEDFLYFFVGFFVGGGLVLGNRLYAGRTGNAAALGSMPIGIDGSRVRQLVDVASLASLEKSLAAGGFETSAIWDSPDDWALPKAQSEAWADEAAGAIAVAILSAASVIDFQCILIDGWMPTEMRAGLVRRTNERLGALAIEGIAVPTVREGTVGGDARSLGAASLPLSERFLVDRDAFLKG